MIPNKANRGLELNKSDTFPLCIYFFLLIFLYLVSIKKKKKKVILFERKNDSRLYFTH
jgi:hypothetical protein